MKQVVQNFRNGELNLQDVPVPALKSGTLLVATRCSLISAGTEKQMIDLAKANLAGKAIARPDLVKQVLGKIKREGLAPTLETVFAKLDNPAPLGYSIASTLVEVSAGVLEFQAGDRIACAGAGYANHAEFNAVPKNLCARIPDEVDDEDASFVTLGAIALQGVRQAEPCLGDIVAVTGLGLLGQLTVQLLKANGCRVIGFDPDPTKASLAETLGADMAVSHDFASAVRGFTLGNGADIVIVTASTKSDGPVNDAAQVCRMKGRIVVVGVVGMDLERDAYYKKELDLRLSMSYGPGRYDPSYEEGGHDYPYAYVRWTEQRNMQAFLELIAQGRITPKKLITHRFDIHDAEKAYALLASDEPYLGVVLTYKQPTTEKLERKITLSTQKTKTSNNSKSGAIGFIGAGNYAKAKLLPPLQKNSDVRFSGIVTSTGVSARHVADKFGFAFAATDHYELLEDDDTTTVFIATRHDSHAALTTKALKAGKHVFIEKPLALNREQLAEVLQAHATSQGKLMVGFNRRFSPFVREAKAVLAGRNAPLVMHYRVNAGFIPAESWIHGAEGGGRIIGEACHFIDVMCYLTGALPTQVSAIAAEGYPDALTAQIRFADGSIGSLTYTSLGDKSVPKEYLEVFTDGLVITINDYRTLSITKNGKSTKRKLAAQDKGQKAMLEAFLTSITQDNAMPIPVDELAAVTEASFAIEDDIGGHS
ncbi:MAG: bi-domain-containing oxidoreductase [Robiginitomaculum sp.]|nr:bi-domain-containing oxidoreductase [Robiginitomaculum sp.]